MTTQKRTKKTVRANRKGRASNKAAMQIKGLSQETASNELKNFFSSSDFAILFLDRQLRLKWFTPGIQPLFTFRQTDIGKTINNFSETVIGTGINRDAKMVLKKELPQEREIKLPNDLWYLRRILPYRDVRKAVTGIIIRFSNISEIKRQTEALLAANQQMAETQEQRIQERTQQLRALSMELALAEERERRALARDLHDDLGQLLAVAKIKIASLSKLEKTADLKQRVEEIKQILDKAHTSVHSLTFQLSPPILHELGLIPALEWLSEEMQRSYGLDVKLHDDHKSKPLEMSVRTILFRAVRELLINVAKHAKVARATVTTTRVAHNILIEVADEGIGFKPDHLLKIASGRMGGFGLLNVRERLSYIGGEVHTESFPGDGSRISLLAPLAIKTRVKEKHQ